MGPSKIDLPEWGCQGAPSARRDSEGLAAPIRIAIAACFGAILNGCLPWTGLLFSEAASVGTTSMGALGGATHLAPEGTHYRLYRRSDRVYATPSMVGLVTRAAEAVARCHPGTVLSVGDISGMGGGRISGHRSHRAGRDIDLAFFATDLFGEPVESTPLARFDRFGIAPRGDDAVLFDTARNWTLVAALLEDPEVEVQWIFVSRGVKALLLEHALAHCDNPATLERAVDVLRQPGDSTPHDDHFHVRIYCPNGTEGAFCMDTPPFWPWIRADRSTSPACFTDAVLLEYALEGM